MSQPCLRSVLVLAVGGRMGRWYLPCTAVAGLPAHVGVICKLTAPVLSGVASPGDPLTPPNASQAPENVLAEHYHDLRRKPFYPALISYMSSGPVVAMVCSGRSGGRGGRPLTELRAAEPLVNPTSPNLYLCAAGLGRPQCGPHLEGHDRTY